MVLKRCFKQMDVKLIFHNNKGGSFNCNISLLTAFRLNAFCSWHVLNYDSVPLFSPNSELEVSAQKLSPGGLQC